MTSASSAAKAYPWGSLDVVARADADAGRALRRWGASHLRADEAARALAALLDARVDVLVKRVRGVTRAAGADDGLAVLVAAGDASDGVTRAALLEAEAPLAAALVARAIRRATPRVVDPGHASSPAMAGALGAVLVAATRRAHADRALRVIAAGPASALARDVAAAAGELIEATLTVLIDDDAYLARVTLPRAMATGAPDARWTTDTLAALGDLPIAIPIVAAASASTAAEIGSLRRGDAWLPTAWALRRTASGELAGPVLLAAPSHEIGIGGELGEDGRLVLRGEIESLAWTPTNEEGGVTESDKDALVEAVGEVPVVVRVEIGVAEMRAREWASLGKGDVIALGRKIGEAVTLRVGGVAVARGELVDLDGEVGVRILGRSEGDR